MLAGAGTVGTDQNGVGGKGLSPAYSGKAATHVVDRRDTCMVDSLCGETAIGKGNAKVVGTSTGSSRLYPISVLGAKCVPE